MKNGNMPVSPTIYADMGNNGQREIFCDNQGLTKREYTAIKIMAALISEPSLKGNKKEFAIQAIECADALLAELEKSE